MLRAAYFAQELLSTFSTSLGEVSLVPSTGGVFTVDLIHTVIPALKNQAQASNEGDERWNTQTTRIWDRKAEGGFPEIKTLKKLVRDIIDPSRDLGHVDRQKMPAPLPPKPALSEEFSHGSDVNFQNKKSTQVVKTTQATRPEDNNDSNKFLGNEEGEQGGSLPIEVEVKSRLSVRLPEKPQRQQQRQEEEQEQKKSGNSRVVCEDCTQ